MFSFFVSLYQNLNIMANFVILGEAYTERIRDLWASKDFSKAIEYALNGIEGMTLDYLIPIIDGTKQLVGKYLDYVDDNFEQDFKYVDVFKYADMNSDMYQRIYNEDMDEGNDIIRWFSRFEGYLWRQDGNWQMKAARWNKLLPDVKNELSEKMPYWMSLHLRRADTLELKIKKTLTIDEKRNEDLKGAAISNKSLLYQYFDEISTDREKFDKKCAELYLYYKPDLDEIWESMQRMIKRYDINTFDETDDVIEPSENKIKEILEEALIKDIKMESKNGWLSPSGLYYICEHGGHRVLAELICEKYKYPTTEETKLQNSYSDVLLKIGWAQIHQPERWERFRITHKNTISYDQNIKIERYEAVHKIKLEDIII